MKHNLNRFSLLLAMLSFFACKKVENKNYLEAKTIPVLTASTAAVNLQPGIESNTAITFNWTNPEYRFTSGISSQDVNYTFEMDTAGTNFTSAKKFETIYSKDLSKSFTVGELNNILGNTMLLPINNPRRTYNFEVKVTASIGPSKAAPMASNIFKFTASPFTPPPKVEVPANGTLWMVGDAGFGGWNNPLIAPYDASQKFTKISNTLYQLTVNLPGGGGYKLIQIAGDWGSQYHMTTGTWATGNFEKKDSDPQFPGVPSAGTYRITVDFQLGVYNVVKL